MDVDMEKICITGGAGMIGSHLTEHLISEGYQPDGIIVVDDFSRGTYRHPEVEYIEIDLSRQSYPHLLKVREIDTVIHLAAYLGGVKLMHNDQFYSGKNFNINFNTFKSCLESGSVEQVFFTSTACVYPEHLQERSMEGYKLKEEDIGGEPESIYGWSKLMGEYLAEYLQKEHGIPVYIARPFNVYGPRETCEDLEGGHVIPSLIRKVLLNGKPLHIWGDGGQTRSFLYASDAAKGITTIIDKGTSGEPYNLGNPGYISIAELGEKILKSIYGEASSEDLVFLLDEPTGMYHRCPDVQKTLNLGWNPSVSLDEGLSSTIDYYRKLWGPELSQVAAI